MNGRHAVVAGSCVGREGDSFVTGMGAQRFMRLLLASPGWFVRSVKLSSVIRLSTVDGPPLA